MHRPFTTAGLLATGALLTAATRTSLFMQFPTGFDESGTALTVPSIDPSGITYHHPSGHLFIVDSEIDEVDEAWDEVGANIFEVSPAGDVLYGAWDLRVPIPRNSEPSGIVYNPVDGFFYSTNDAHNRVYRYAFDPETGFTVDDVFKHTGHQAGSGDPEDITVDPATGVLYIVDGRARSVFPIVYDESIEDMVPLPRLDLPALNDPQNVPSHPQGIAFDPASGHLFLVSARDEAVFEYTIEGLFVAAWDLDDLVPDMLSPQGLTFAPTGAALGIGLDMPAYIVDAGVDNNDDPSERDGRVFIVDLGWENRRPSLDPIADLAADEDTPVGFAATATDPDGDVLTFSLFGAVPAGAAIDPGTGLFTWTPSEAQGHGGYLVNVRVTDDGTPPLADETTFLVMTGEVNEPPTLTPIDDMTVAPGAEVAFEVSAIDPDLKPALVDGLMAYWPFDAGAAQVRSATGAFDGSMQKGAEVVHGAGSSMLGDGALYLDGRNDHVIFGDMPLAGDFTVAAWVLPENIASSKNSRAVVLGDANNRDWLRLEADGVGSKFDGAKETFTTDPDFVNGTWQHFAVVREAGQVTVYRDGEAASAGETSDSPFTPEWIGRKKPNARNYGGMMDDLVVWDRPLGAEGIALLHGGGTGRAADDVGAVAANSMTFGFAGAVPEAATMDPSSGSFHWTAPAGFGTYTFTVTVTDDGDPPGYDEHTFTITVGTETSADDPPVATCPDVDGDGWVGMSDLIELLAAWVSGTGLAFDVDGDGLTGPAEVDAVIAGWGPCP